MMASILFLDKEGKHLLHGAAPSLPQAYNEAINGVAIGPVAGSCGTAAFRGESVFAEDIADDPLWVDYRELAMTHGLRACWSTPIRAVNGRVLGTFALYYREVRGPTQQDLESIALIAHTVALAIERHLSEQALRESRERLQLALDGAELGVWSVDLESGRLESDARDISIHRHNPNAPPTTLAEARTFVHPDDLPGLDSAFAAAQQVGGTCKAEYRVCVPGRALTDQTHWVGVEGTLVRDAKGRPLRMLGVTRDISVSKLAEENLRQREQAFRTLLEALPGAVYTTDASGRITFFNKAAVDMWGSCPRLGYTQWGGAWSLYHLDGTPMADDESPLAMALEEDRPIRNVAVIGVRPDGTRVHFIPYPTPLHDESGALIGAVNMLIDVTDLKKAEVALRESETRLRQALTAGQVMAFEWDPRTGLSQRSGNAAQILGCKPGQLADGVRNSFLARVHPDDRTSFKAHVYGVRPDDPSYSAIFRFLHPDGHVVWLEETAEAEFDAAGHFVRLKGVTRDVSERKRAEEHQSLLMAELDHRVKNALACVSVVAQRSREGSPSMDDFLEVLNGRIRSMANSHALLSRGRWQGVSLADLIHCELAPCVAQANAIVEGPDVVLAAEATQAVAMVLHELVTNAAKYGALSTPHGRVAVRWDWPSTGNSSGQLALEWQEIGGPSVVAPKDAGYGTSVIRDLIPYELGGKVDLLFVPEGVRCELKIPGDWLSSSNRSGRFINGSGSALLHHAEQSAALLR
jgi:PAS domain S-box-containing protein